MQCLNRLIPQCIPAAVSGRISVGGRPVGDEPVAEMSRQVGVVFQNPRTQLFNVRVEDEVAFGPRNLGLEPREVEDRVGWALACVGMAHLRSHSTHALSGGERQRLAIAAVLAMGSRLLVLDEPMASLDVEGTRAVIDTVRRLNTRERRDRHSDRASSGARGGHRRRGPCFWTRARVVADGPTERVLGERALLRRLGLRRPAEDTQMIWRDLVEPGPTLQVGAARLPARGDRRRGPPSGAHESRSDHQRGRVSWPWSATTAPARARLPASSRACSSRGAVW